MNTKYMNNPDYNFEKVNRASLACGPMVKWAIAQVCIVCSLLLRNCKFHLQLNYSDMLNRVEPLRNELSDLEASANSTRQKNDEVFKLIGELEKSIQRYKEEYAVLISQAQAIKTDLASVEAKVERSVALLKSLGGERGRWEQGSEAFKNQMSTIIGDVLLMSAFMTYAGE